MFALHMFENGRNRHAHTYILLHKKDAHTLDLCLECINTIEFINAILRLNPEESRTYILYTHTHIYYIFSI